MHTPKNVKHSFVQSIRRPIRFYFAQLACVQTEERHTNRLNSSAYCWTQPLTKRVTIINTTHIPTTQFNIRVELLFFFYIFRCCIAQNNQSVDFKIQNEGKNMGIYCICSFRWHHAAIWSLEPFCILDVSQIKYKIK